ncbi:hypothetical protein NBV64_06075 [Alcaligenes sp. DN25]|uniref:hypothetical protein n=1 Tax=Alcaligenes TaxID=507 RepID=UPI00203087FF|nr:MULTISPECIES: hypothetical protein [Alcaligenes]URW83919.1 hypothetical protein NBV64_06075 [Alcaligenes sp. DN25]WEA68757.1 hypothetical protein PWH35_06085 [Alcaligenes faecalis]
MSEKKCSCEREMLGALVAGAALGGVITFTLLVYFWEWGVVNGAQWWDVMTAFGTVGASAGALYTVLLGTIKNNREKNENARLVIKGFEFAFSKFLEETKEIDMKKLCYSPTNKPNSNEKPYLKMIESLEDIIKIKINDTQDSTLLICSTRTRLNIYRSIKISKEINEKISNKIKKVRDPSNGKEHNTYQWLNEKESMDLDNLKKELTERSERILIFYKNLNKKLKSYT